MCIEIKPPIRLINHMVLLKLIVLILLVPACKQEPSQTVLEPYLDSWVVLNYWAEWCAPCLEEIPELNKLDKSHSNISVVMVNYDGVSGDTLKKLAETMQIKVELMELDEAKTLKLARPQGLPATYIYDPTGSHVSTLIGPQTEKSLIEQIEYLKQM